MKVKELVEQLKEQDQELEVVLYLKWEEDGSEVRDGVKTIENNDENWPYCKGDFPEVEGDKIVIIS